MSLSMRRPLVPTHGSLASAAGFTQAQNSLAIRNQACDTRWCAVTGSRQVEVSRHVHVLLEAFNRHRGNGQQNVTAGEVRGG
jgi:lipid A disaccharide synthetase